MFPYKIQFAKEKDMVNPFFFSCRFGDFGGPWNVCISKHCLDGQKARVDHRIARI